MDQPGMRAAEARLNAGDWVHVFPEGTRSRDGKMGPIRRGIGHLVAACSSPPLRKFRVQKKQCHPASLGFRVA